MPIADNDLLLINRATRSGSTNIEVNMTWTDGTTGENKGTYSVQWATADELKAFLEQQSFDDLARSLMLQCLNRTTGALRPTVFDAMPGKTFRVMIRVQEV